MGYRGVRDEVRDEGGEGFEALSVDEARLAQLGLADFTFPVKIDCATHSNPGTVLIQQWNAKDQTWKVVATGIEPDREIIDPLIEEDSMAYAKENNITPRTCE